MEQDQLTPQAVISFLQAATNSFWNIEKAIIQNETMIDNLNRSKEDAAVIIRSMMEAFPDAMESIQMIQMEQVPLEVDRVKASTPS